MSTLAPVEVGVEPTGSMKRTGEFVCQVGPAVAASLGLGGGGLVVVERDVTDHGVLTAIGRLQVDASVGGDVARLDQTLRKSVGISDAGTGSTVRLHRIWHPIRRRIADTVARWLGAQYLHLRVRQADILDAEKRVCRVPGDAFVLLGCGHGDVVVCEGVRYEQRVGRYEVSRIRLRALEGLTPPRPSQVVAAAPMLGQQQDIRWIRLDQQARGELNAALSLASVRIRRDVRRRVVDGLRDAGIAFFLSQFAILSLTDVHGLARAAVVGLLAVLAVGYVIWKIRSELP